MKAYQHTGQGHYIGSCVIVIAETDEQAKAMIRTELDRHGLPHEAVGDVSEFELKPGTIWVDNGDY